MSGFFIGIDVGGTNLKAGLVNDEGSILAMEKRKIAEVSVRRWTVSRGIFWSMYRRRNERWAVRCGGCWRRRCPAPG